MTSEPTLDLTGPWPTPDADCRRLWLAATARAAAEDGAWQTTTGAGSPGLREQLAAALSVPADRLVVTAGVRAAAAALARTARTVLVECPTFAGIPPVFRAAGCELRLRTWETLPDEQRRWAPDLVWLTSPCRNPDGRSVPSVLVEELVAGPGRVVVNEVYRWFAPAEPAPAGCLAVGSTSKLAGGGARIGWIHDPDGMVELSPADRAVAPAHLLQETWAHFLAAGGAAALGRAVVEPTARASVAFRAAAGLPAGPDAPFLLLDAAPGHTEDDLVAAFARAGLRVGPGAAFHAPVPAARLCVTLLSRAEASEAGARTRALLAGGHLRGPAAPP